MNSIFFNELTFMSWFYEEHKFYCHILCPSQMSECYFSKVFVILECNSNKLLRIANESKQRIHEMDTHDSEYVMNCTTSITSILKT